MPPPSDRIQALRILTRWQREGFPPDDDPGWDETSALTRELVWGCLRHKASLEAWMDYLSLRSPSAEIRPVLALGLYQVLLLDGIAPHAAVHETLEAARHFRFPQPLIGYANALLRRAAREKESLLMWLSQQEPEKRYSHPGLLVRRWREQHGPEILRSILEWNQQRSRTWVRLTPSGLASGYDAALPDGSAPHPHFPGFWSLPRGCSPTTLPGFAEGAWYVQDPSTTIAPRMLNVHSGEAVLDACAAPGGKAILLAEALGSGGTGLVAADPNPKRVRRLRENLLRMSMHHVAVRVADLSELQGPFDAILLDVPCTNTGVLQRRPDARWSFSLSFLHQLNALQAQILDQASTRVRPGGRLVYSTCSIEPEETHEQLRLWLARHPGWSLAEERLLLPGELDCDGAYAALCVRTR